MKKVLIISYFFPPCNLTASHRAYNWAKYLKEFGYDPIVLTRKWDIPIQKPSDMGISSLSQDIEKKENDQYRVIYMPYIGSKRDRIYVEHPERKIIRKALSLKELFLQNYNIKALPYANIYYKAEELILQEKIQKVIITGNPFACFHFGYELKQKFPSISWIADYRDDWTTTQLSAKPKGLAGKLFRLEQKSEKKWVGTAAFLTTVSQYYVDKISKFTGVKGYELLNGFDEEIEQLPEVTPSLNSFVITYNGSLYPSQKIEPFLRVVKKMILKYKQQLIIELKFPGLAFDHVQEERVKRELDGVMDQVTITERIDREEVLKIQQLSHLLLMVAHDGIKGVPSSKLYEYIGLKKPVLLYPGDHDIIEKTLKETQLGIICNSEEEIEQNLSKLIEEFIESGKIPIARNNQKIANYSRKKQVEVLAKLLDTI